MDGLLNAIKVRAAQLDSLAGQPRLALVTSVNTGTYCARVQIQPEGILSGWLPIASAWVGAGWGLIACPSPGDQVIALPQEGLADHGLIVGRLWSSEASPPNAPAGECWLVHKSGSYLKLCNDGSIQSQASKWSHQGDLHVSGDVYDRHGSLSRLRGHYNLHVHPPDSSTASPID